MASSTQAHFTCNCSQLILPQRGINSRIQISFSCTCSSTYLCPAPCADNLSAQRCTCIGHRQGCCGWHSCSLDIMIYSVQHYSCRTDSVQTECHFETGAWWAKRLSGGLCIHYPRSTQSRGQCMTRSVTVTLVLLSDYRQCYCQRSSPE